MGSDVKPRLHGCGVAGKLFGLITMGREEDGERRAAKQLAGMSYEFACRGAGNDGQHGRRPVGLKHSGPQQVKPPRFEVEPLREPGGDDGDPRRFVRGAGEGKPAITQPAARAGWRKPWESAEDVKALNEICGR
jgi:hypothetical protein